MGVSVEDQIRAAQRIPALLATPATFRYLSCEPLLSALDLTPWLAHLNWVIVGGESVPTHRPMHPDWARSLRDQCADHDAPFFFKQWGGRTPAAGGHLLDGLVHHDLPSR